MATTKVQSEKGSDKGSLLLLTEDGKDRLESGKICQRYLLINNSIHNEVICFKARVHKPPTSIRASVLPDQGEIRIGAQMVLRVSLNVDDFDVDATSTFNLEILVVRKRGAEVTRTLFDWWNIIPTADTEKHAIQVRVEPRHQKVNPLVHMTPEREHRKDQPVLTQESPFVQIKIPAQQKPASEPSVFNSGSGVVKKSDPKRRPPPPTYAELMCILRRISLADAGKLDDVVNLGNVKDKISKPVDYSQLGARPKVPAALKSSKDSKLPWEEYKKRFANNPEL